MNNSINVDYMTKSYYDFLTGFGIQNTQSNGTSFLESAMKKIAAGEILAEEENPIDTRNMTMEEYKQYIYQKISSIPIHPSQAGWHWSIQISDEGFEAMKNNPKYEEYVLGTIRSNFSFMDRFHTQSYSILRFGATKEETSGEVFSFGSAVERKAEEKSFWERRAERKKRQKEQYDNWLEKRAAAKRIRQRLILEKDFSQAAAISEANILASGIGSSVILSKKS